MKKETKWCFYLTVFDTVGVVIFILLLILQSNTTQWEVKTEQATETYSIEVDKYYCSINVSQTADGRELTSISASDPDWYGKQTVTYTRFVKNSWGNVVLERHNVTFHPMKIVNISLLL